MQVEASMFESVHDMTARGLLDFPTKPRHEWVLQWPGMAVLVVSAIFWTQGAIFYALFACLRVRLLTVYGWVQMAVQMAVLVVSAVFWAQGAIFQAQLELQANASVKLCMSTKVCVQMCVFKWLC